VSDSRKVITMPPPRPYRPSPGERRAARTTLTRALLVVVFFFVGLILFACLRPLELLLTVLQLKLRVDGISSRYTNIDGYRIHYFEGGSGQPILLIHGLGSRAEDWANIMPQLVHGGRHVYAIDMLGYGRSSRPADAAYSIPAEAGVVEKFLASQNLRQTDLGGWSMGGWVAIRVALDEPERVRRLAIYDSAGLRFDLPFKASLFWPDNPAALTALNDLLSPGRGPHIPALMQRDVLRLVQRNGWIVQRSMESMLTGADLVDGKLSTLKMPVLIVWGKNDQLTPVALAYTFHAQIPQSVLEIYDGCGHLAPRECADRIGPNTLAFLNAEPPMPPQVKEIPAGK
jgi:pimeloyl-ACP methyl ester carboxylesterase